MSADVGEVAAAHLRRTGNPAIMWGDVHLLHEIAGLMGWESLGSRTERRVLGALNRSVERAGERSPFVKRYTATYCGPRAPDRLVRVFRLRDAPLPEER